MNAIRKQQSIGKNPVFVEAQKIAGQISRDLKVQRVGKDILATYKRPVKTQFGEFFQGMQFSPTSGGQVMVEHIAIFQGQVYRYGEAYHMFSKGAKGAVPSIRSESIEFLKDLLNASESTMDRMELRR